MKEVEISEKVGFLAKEKGFYIEGTRSFNIIFDPNTIRSLAGKYTDEELKDYYYSNKDLYLTCTQSLLQKWLREVHSIHINPLKEYNNKNTYTYEMIFWIEDIQNSIQMDSYNTYEEALEAGLIEALKTI